MVESRAGRVVIGSDHAGISLKPALIRVLEARGFDVEDLGTHGTASVDYPDFAHAVATRVSEGEAELGVLVCGSGIGMSIAANRHRGIRAVVCSEPYSARMARAHNNANVLCLGARVVGEGLAAEILEAFVKSVYEGGRHESRVLKIEV